MTHAIGIVDTTFAGIDMSAFVIAVLQKELTELKLHHRTVPGIKDIPVACKKLIEEERCDIVIALGMPGAMPIDKQCAHEASQGIQYAQLLTNTHILEVFVHYDEGTDADDLYALAKDRCEKHALNAVYLISQPHLLSKNRGQGIRQGRPSIGPVRK